MILRLSSDHPLGFLHISPAPPLLNKKSHFTTVPSYTQFNSFLKFSSLFLFKMPIRNPFTRRPPPPLVTLTQTQDENRRPGSGLGSPATPGSDVAHPGFERVDTVGSSRTGASSAFSIRSSRRSQDTGEYKMSGMCFSVLVEYESGWVGCVEWRGLGFKE